MENNYSRQGNITIKLVVNNLFAMLTAYILTSLRRRGVTTHRCHEYALPVFQIPYDGYLRPIRYKRHSLPLWLANTEWVHGISTVQT